LKNYLKDYLNKYNMNTHKILIGLSGKMGVGKDYIAQNIILPYLEKRNIKTLIIAFADQIKVNTSVKNNISLSKMYDTKNEDIRKLLQKEGTENGRDKYGNNIWIDYVDKWTDVYSKKGIQAFIITDCRFKNEVDYIKKNNGVIIRIEAPLRNKERIYKEKDSLEIQKHISEIDLDDYKFDNIINNDYISNEENELINKNIKDNIYKILNIHINNYHQL